jgi:hypothetical protein
MHLVEFFVNFVTLQIKELIFKNIKICIQKKW